MTGSRQGHLRLLIAAAFAALAAGCQDNRGPVSIHSNDPDLQIVAIKRDQACPTHDELAQMVLDLESDDPAIRFYAIQSLERITHDTYGYLFYQDEDQRAAALKRWQNWMKGR